MGNRKKLGLVVNPIAGLGGRVGLKGSDDPDILARALALGGKPEAPVRAGYALAVLAEMEDHPEIYTYGGEMGEEELESSNLHGVVLGSPQGARTSAIDTMDAARLMLEEGVDLLLFAGGDGTARDICEAVGSRVPVIGIPAGVKIHSSVYAINARSAGLVAREYLEGRIQRLRECEVVDIDETLFRQGRISAKLYGYMNVPEAGSRMQNMKTGSGSEETDLLGVAGYISCTLEDDTLYIIGPGSTTRGIMEDLGLANTLLGVDVVKNRELVASDVSERSLWELLKEPQQKAKIIVTVIGGQGHLFGRGNQQISPRVIRRVGRDNIIVAASTSKILALKGGPLLVDTGDTDLDRELGGFIEVITSFGQSTYCRVCS